MVYAEIALLKKVNWMTMKASFTSKITISTTLDIYGERKFIDEGLRKMMDHAIIRTKQVEWSCTSSDDDQIGYVPEVRCQKKVTIKCTWLDNALLDMVVQDEEQSMELHVDIATEYQGEGPFKSPLPRR
jgi:hypothetical protein